MGRQYRVHAVIVMGLLLISALAGGLFPPGSAQAQVIITLILPTATRTPTPVNIGNLVWDDIDHDGRQDAGEPGLAGITVQLWNPTKTALIDQATTNASGIYSVQAPQPGDYRIRVLLPGGMDAFSPKDQAGGDDLLDSDINPSGPDLGFSDVFNLASNVISTTTRDAGIIIFRTPTPTRTPTPINIGNFVWHDLNANGIQDAGEPGVPGVTVQLWNDLKTELVDSAVTNANGNYFLVAPLPGDYRVRVLKPNGSSYTTPNQGGDDTKDSDIANLIISSNYGFTGTITIASNVISITSIDAGLTNVPPPATPTPPTPATSTPTATQTATSSSGQGTPQPAGEWKISLPLVTR